MEKTQVLTAKSESSLPSPSEIFRRIEGADLRAVTGRGRLRVPIGYTDTGEPIYADEDNG